MSKSSKNLSSSKNNHASAPAPVVVVPPNKQARLARTESVARIPLTSTDADSLEEFQHPHPTKKASPPIPAQATTAAAAKEETPALETTEVPSDASGSTSSSTRAPRDPHGHKLIKVRDALEASHKTKYLPLGDGQNTYAVFFQPWEMKEWGKNWCEMEMLELVNGTKVVTSLRVYSIDAEDLLKMCYLHAMANYDVKNIPRLHYEQWVLSIFQKYCEHEGSADYTDRGSIARYYLYLHGYDFSVGEPNANGEPSRLEMFYQKRCIRDLGATDCDRVAGRDEPRDNLCVVQGKSVKAKFEYQIEGYIMCVPEGAGTKQRREEREKKEREKMEE